MVERLSFSYPDEYKKELQKLAKKNARTLSGYIQWVLNQHMLEKGFDTTKPKPKQKPKQTPKPKSKQTPKPKSKPKSKKIKRKVKLQKESTL